MEAARTSEADEKCEHLEDFQQELLADVDVVPLATAPVHVLFAGGVTGGVYKGFAVPGTIRIDDSDS